MIIRYRPRRRTAFEWNDVSLDLLTRYRYADTQQERYRVQRQMGVELIRMEIEGIERKVIDYYERIFRNALYEKTTTTNRPD